MRLEEIRQLLSAQNLTEQLSLEKEVEMIHASDLISEVLASCTQGAVWLTGLLDMQIVNAAELFDLSCVIFVGNRKPDNVLLEAAVEESIPILMTEFSMFEACGLLYSSGLKSAKRNQ